MRRFLPVLLTAFAVSAQVTTQTLDKPPQDVDDALRARIKQFYDYHVARKYRLAEQLVAEESKDDFYVLSKPELQQYKIGGIEYSDKFAKAKVVIVGAMPVLLPMAGGKIMDLPFASYWKVENGTWCWYYNKEAASVTPFGKVKSPGETKPGEGPTSLPNAATMTPEQLIGQVQSALKIDRTSINVTPGKPQTIKVTNTLPGPAHLSIECPAKPIAQTGIIAKFDKSDLKGNDSATLTFTIDSNTPLGAVPLQITVSPTNQILNLMVIVGRE
jgi:hypothetical protein